jgi:hypothetical protein
MPWVDVDADMDAVNRGDGYFHAGTRQTWINGRLYGMHDNGTTYPIQGEGIIPCGRETYRALIILRKYNGVNERSDREVTMSRSITEWDRHEAGRIWRLREEAEGDEPDRGN